MSTTKRDDAIVLGSGIMGLLAAAVLARHFRRVTIVERDVLPDGMGPRKGIPQARHAHVLLERGMRTIERFLPGLREDMSRAGAITLDWGSDMLFRTPFGVAKDFATGHIVAQTAGRDLLESVIRDRVRKIENVSWKTGSGVRRLLGTREAVRGVAFDEGTEELEADLIVDATGVGSRVRAWLEELGCALPQEVVVDSRWKYVSCLFEDAAPLPNGKKAAMVLPSNDVQRGGALGPQENGRIMVTGASRDHDRLSRDPAGFVAFFRSFTSPVIGDTIANARPVGPIHMSRSLINRIRRFDLIPNPPRNFIAIGDSACAVNAIYGQGMSTASMTAECLDEMLAAGEDVARYPQRLYKRASKVQKFVWDIATTEDFRYPDTTGKRPRGTAALHWYMDRVARLTVESSEVTKLYMQVFHLLASPFALFKPGVLAQAIGLSGSAKARWRY